MCDILGVSRDAYYKWRKKQEQPDPDAKRMEIVQTVDETTHKRYGYRRITIHLQDKLGMRINHKAVFRLMRNLGIRLVARQSYPYRKMQNLGTFPRYENLLNRDLVAQTLNQKWVTDNTFVRLHQGPPAHHQGPVRWLHCRACSAAFANAS